MVSVCGAEMRGCLYYGKSGSREGTRTRLGVTFRALILVSDLLPPVRSHLGKAPQLPQLGKKLWKQEPEGDLQIQTKQGSFQEALRFCLFLPHSPLGKQPFSEGTHSSEGPAEHAKPPELHRSYFVPSPVRCVSPSLLGPPPQPHGAMC